MTEVSSPTATLYERLKQCGDPRKTRYWPQGDPDYVTAVGLRREHVPALIDVRRHIDDDGGPEDRDPDPAAWHAPIHAWRALAQLRAVPAVRLLLDMLEPMDENGDDWHLEEFPDALAMIGPPAFDPVADYLAHASHPEYARICAAHALVRIAQKHPDLCGRAVGSLTERLAEYARNTPELNAFLIGYLVDLGATESAELMERAYAAGRVDEEIVGDWDTVRRELGVEGLGLVSEKQARRDVRPAYLRPPDQSASQQPERSFKSRAPEKRRKERAARKRNKTRRR